MQRWNSFSGFAIIFILLLALPLQAAGLQEIQESYSKHKDFTANFEQDTYQFMLKKNIHFKGKVSYKKDVGVRMDVYEPQRQLIILKGSTVWIHLPDDGSTSMQEIPKEFASSNILAFFAGITSLEADYNVSQQDGYILLSPKQGVGELRIKVDAKHLITNIALQDATGNESKIELKDYAFDTVLPASLFEQDMPAKS